VRGGHLDALQLLVRHGADYDALTDSGKGISPYNIAKRSLPEHHPVTQYLHDLGAINIGPEL
jgi:hypothetical protein